MKGNYIHHSEMTHPYGPALNVAGIERLRSKILYPVNLICGLFIRVSPELPLAKSDLKKRK